MAPVCSLPCSLVPTLNQSPPHPHTNIYFHITITPMPMRCRHSSVSIVTRLRVDRGTIPSRGRTIFCFNTASRPALWPTQTPIQWVPGILSLGVKWPEIECDNSLTSSAEVKNEWSYTSTPPHGFMHGA
jgi:hypothetical protein